MNCLNKDQCIELLDACRKEIAENVPFLCELDSFVGDGDHGITVSRGFDQAYSKVVDANCANPYEVFNLFSKELGRAMGGAIGPIFQSIFLGMSNAIKDKESIDVKDFCEMQKKALQSVMVIGGAKEGDRTLVDALAPAVRSFQGSLEAGKSFEECISEAEKAAEIGCKKTIDMIAKKGRAKFLGENSRGHQDAGATSMYYIYKAFKSYIRSK